MINFKYETRKIAANGHEPTDTDGGIQVSAGNFSCESYILGYNFKILKKENTTVQLILLIFIFFRIDHYQIEIMANMAEVPEKGALILVSVPKIARGSGFPARLISFLPPSSNQTLLWDLFDSVIADKEFVDLTHSFDNDIPTNLIFHFIILEN